MGVGVPVATTVKETLVPAVTVWVAAGWVVMAGATGTGFTVSTLALLVRKPAVLVTVTV